MSENQSNSAGLVAGWVMRAALRLWPRESGDWGRALAAELPSTASSWEAVRWTMGGLMVLMREWMRHAMGSWKRPIGVPVGGPLETEWKNAPRVPRTPRWVTAVLLVASACLLVTPDGRNGIISGLRAWRQYEPWFQDQAFLAKLRAEANRHRDPQLLAVIAIMSDDNDEKVRDADEAVQADPSLTWIYSKIRLNEKPCCILPPLTIESGLAALEKWDPDNAVPRFLTADEIYGRIEKDWISHHERDSFYFHPNSVWRDPAWRAAMDFAYLAPKFDSYNARALELYHAVSARYDINEPEFAASFLRQSAFLSGLRNAGVDVYFEEAEEAERSGHLDAAASLYWKPVLFDEQVLSQDHSDDWWVIQKVVTERDAFQRLEPLLVKMGRTDEARIVQYRLAGAQAAIEDHYGWWWWNRRDGWAGLEVRSLSPIILLLGAAIGAGIGVLFPKRHKETEPSGFGVAAACAAIDLCPVLLLIASAALFVVYRPISLTYQHAISFPWNGNTLQDIFYAANAPYGIPLPLGEFSAMYLDAYHFWMAAIVALSMLAVYIIFRRTLRGSNTI